MFLRKRQPQLQETLVPVSTKGTLMVYSKQFPSSVKPYFLKLEVEPMNILSSLDSTLIFLFFFSPGFTSSASWYVKP